jgi:hypothetical protein
MLQAKVGYSEQRQIALVGETESGTGVSVSLVDVSNPTNPVVLIDFLIEDFTYLSTAALSVDGQFMFVLGNSFRKYDISNPQKPVLLGSIDQQILGLAVHPTNPHRIFIGIPDFSTSMLSEVDTTIPGNFDFDPIGEIESKKKTLEKQKENSSKIS